MERRHQVFISSTYVDLKDERRAIQEAILELDCFPAGMELFPASNEDAWSLIKGVIENSDYYLLVIGGKYGSIDEESRLSYTEKEFDFAVSIGKPIMAFLHSDPGSIPAAKSEMGDDARKKLEAFRAKVKGSKHVKHWSTADDLAGKVSRSFTQVRKQSPAVGWIRGDTETSAESLAENISLRKEIDALKQQLAAIEGAKVAAIEDLAGGDDEVAVDVSCTTSVYILDAGEWGDDVFEVQASLPLGLTWNELLAEIGPLLIDEARQGAIKRRLEDLAEGLLGGQARTDAEAFVVDEGHELAVEGPTSSEPKFTISLRDFEQILIQLRALGLIEMGTRKRGVNDVGPWWKLTRAGDARLTTARAVRRPVSD